MNAPTMIRQRNGLPVSVWDLTYPPPDGYHAAPVDRDWTTPHEPVEFVTPEQLHVELSHRPGPKPQWTPVEIREIRQQYWQGGTLTIADVATKLNTTQQSAANLLHGKTYWWC